MASNWKVLHTYAYYRSFFEQNVHPDGRDLNEFAPVGVQCGIIKSSQGSAIVKFGNTSVICSVKVKVSKPSTENTLSAYIIPNVELPRLCSTKFRTGPPSDEAQRLSHFIQDSLIVSECIKMTDLCIEPGRFMYVIYLDFICLSYDGCIEDALFMSMAAALCSTVIPRVIYDKETDRPYLSSSQDNDTTELFALHFKFNLDKLPLAASFLYFNSDRIVPNGSLIEEEIAEKKLLVLYRGDVIQHFDPGCSLIPINSLPSVFKSAQERCKYLRKELQKIAQLSCTSGDETVRNVIDMVVDNK